MGTDKSLASASSSAMYSFFILKTPDKNSLFSSFSFIKGTNFSSTNLPSPTNPTSTSNVLPILVGSLSI
ncbi:hypothetical protein ES703_17803 [subsurface metagenome]